MVRSAGSSTVRAQAQEPQVAVVIGGIMHQVPASESEIQLGIARGFQLQADIEQLRQRRETRGSDLVKLIESHQKEISRLEEQLQVERGPLDSQISAKTAELETLAARLYQLMEPKMGEQKSLKFTGLAGPIEVQRTPKMDVPSENIGALRKLLGSSFVEAFEVTEKAKPLGRAWELLKTWKGRRLDSLKQLVTTSTTGRVRFVVK